MPHVAPQNTTSEPEMLHPPLSVGDSGVFQGTYVRHWELGHLQLPCRDKSGKTVIERCQLRYSEEVGRPLAAMGDDTRSLRSQPPTRFAVRFQGQVLEQGHFGHFGQSTWRVRVDQFLEVTHLPDALPRPQLLGNTEPYPQERFWPWLFTIPEGKRSAWEIIKWWEIRRWVYNAVVFGVGVVSLCAFFFFITASHVLKPGEDAVEPMALLAAPFLINIAYTAGPFVELIANLAPGGSRRTGPVLLKAGFVFSLFVVLLPSVFWGILFLGTRLHASPP